ncbi:MAG TPA: response regulator transcription factor [Candidatus Binataceae bacterium]|nr:response regulator transcription factor [Candidatus Binataceae bacterium]
MAKIRVVVADDHALMRDGIKALLSLADDIEVVGEATNGREAVDRCQRLKPDVVLMDIAMPGLGGLEATLELRREVPKTQVLVLTQYEDREYIQRFLKAGVAGYVLKRMLGSELAAAIRSVTKGGLVLDPQIAREAMQHAPQAPGPGKDDPYETLTDREKQVLRLVALGHSNKEVAEFLGVSVKTAMSHRDHVMEKLDLHSRTDLIKFAIKQGVIRVES